MSCGTRSREGDGQRDAGDRVAGRSPAGELGRLVVNAEDRLGVGDGPRRVVTDHGLPVARGAGQDRPIQREERLERDVRGLLGARRPRSAPGRPAPASAGRCADSPPSQPALRRSVKIVTWRRRIGAGPQELVDRLPARRARRRGWPSAVGESAAARSSSRRVPSTSWRIGVRGAEVVASVQRSYGRVAARNPAAISRARWKADASPAA